MSTKTQRDEWQRLSDGIARVQSPLSTMDPHPEKEEAYAHDVEVINPDGRHVVLTWRPLAKFIAAAREAVPALLQDLAAMTAERNKAADQLLICETSCIAMKGAWNDALEQLRSKWMSAESVISAAWKALGTTAEQAADDPDTASLADSIGVSLQYDREQLDLARTERDAANRKFEDTWKELQAARADAAAMRELVDEGVAWAHVAAGPRLCPLNRGAKEFEAEAKTALSGDAGRALLAEVARLREENAALKAELDDAWKAAKTPVRGMVPLAEVVDGMRAGRDMAAALEDFKKQHLSNLCRCDDCRGAE